MPGVQRFFSKSVPPDTVSGSTPGCAPTRTVKSFGPSQRMASEMSKIAAVKQGRCSPIFFPFSQTAAPNCALLMWRTATSRFSASLKLRWYQNQLRSWWATPAFRTSSLAGDWPVAMRFRISWRLENASESGNPGVDEWASPGTGTLWTNSVGSTSATFESAMSHWPSSAITSRWATHGDTVQKKSRKILVSLMDFPRSWPLCAIVNTLAEIPEHVVARPHGKSNDRHRRGLVRRTWKNARVADVEVWNIVSLCPLVRDRGLGIRSKTTNSRFMQAGPGAIRLIVGAPHLSTHRLEEIHHHLLGVFPHQKLVLTPLKMEAELRNSEYVFLFRVNVDVVCGAGQGRCLNESAYRSRIVTVDVALVLCAKPFDLVVMAWELPTPATDVHRVAADEFLFAWIFQVLPAWHPSNRRIGNVVRSGRLAQELR